MEKNLKECWQCQNWKETYAIKVKGEIEVTRGKCEFREGVVNDTGESCVNFISIERR